MENIRKIQALAWRELYVTFTDRSLLIIMVVTPLVLSTIIALAFGGGSSGDVAVSGIPVAIVNLDKGSGGQNLGDIFVAAFVPPAEGSTAPASDNTCAAAKPSDNSAPQVSLYTLTKAVKVDDADAAKAAVDKGDYVAAVIIPADFTEKVGLSPTHQQIDAASVTVYANEGKAVPAGIIRSIVAGITNQIVTGNIAIASTLQNLLKVGGLGVGVQLANYDFAKGFACAFSPALNTVTVAQQSVTGSPANKTAIAILIAIGSAQAMFFALFTGQGAVSGILEERRQGTLQRLIVSPTPRLVIIVGRLIGTFLTVMFQLIVLVVALTLVGSAFNGSLVFIWGTNVVGLVLVIISMALCASSVGVLLAGLARTPEQGQIFGSLLNSGLAILGGAFGFQLSGFAAQLSMIYWGKDALQKLALGSNDIGVNLLVLLGQGIILFAVGFWLFNRRLDI